MIKSQKLPFLNSIQYSDDQQSDAYSILGIMLEVEESKTKKTVSFWYVEDYKTLPKD